MRVMNGSNYTRSIQAECNAYKCQTQVWSITDECYTGKEASRYKMRCVVFLNDWRTPMSIYRNISANLQIIENHFLMAFVVIIFLFTNKSPISPNIIPTGRMVKYGMLAYRPVEVMVNECTFKLWSFRWKIHKIFFQLYLFQIPWNGR